MSRTFTGADNVFTGDGEMARRCRETDWSATPLGPVETWPPALRTTVRNALESPFPINLWCGDDLVLIYNDAYRRVLGAKHPEALGRPGYDTWSEIWPEIAAMFDRIRETGEAFYSEDAPFVVLRGDQRDVPTDAEPNAWFTFSLSGVRDDAGRVIAFLNIVSETTGRILAERALQRAKDAAERAEARLREVFSQAPAFMILLRGERHVVEYVNEAYYTLVGRRDLIGRPVFDALPEVRGQGFEALLDGVLKTGTPFVGREMPIMVRRTEDAEPEQRYLDFVYYPISEMSGEHSGVVAHGYDITDHVLAREEAKRARTEAELANHAKSQFLANMSHEIRTPINAVVGYTDLLDAKVAGELSQGQQEYVNRIRLSSRHLLSLVNDVLDLAKIEAGEMLLSSTTVAAGPIVEDSVEMVLPHATARRIVIDTVWQCDDDTFVGDGDRVRQILLNLLSNAVKFTQEGGRVTVRCGVCAVPPPDAALPETGPWIALEVEDNGPGIPAELQTRVFEAFVQGEGGLTRSAGGTGLGLTISRRLARMMSGDVTLRSERDAGSRFTLLLPALNQVPPAPRAAHSGSRHLSVFAAAGDALLESSHLIERELVARIRVELPTLTNPLDDAHVADHTASFVAALARSLVALENETINADLLRDGAEQRASASGRHGRQRARLGWSASDLETEYHLIGGIVGAHIRAALRGRSPADAKPVLDAAAHMLASALRAGRDALTAGG